jgi:hypothetical protein
MHPRHAFCGLEPGSKYSVKYFQMVLVDFFKLLLIEVI